jgi:hypothetical protein
MWWLSWIRPLADTRLKMLQFHVLIQLSSLTPMFLYSSLHLLLSSTELNREKYFDK